jgi:hypothetical protein
MPERLKIPTVVTEKIVPALREAEEGIAQIESRCEDYAQGRLNDVRQSISSAFCPEADEIIQGFDAVKMEYSYLGKPELREVLRALRVVKTYGNPLELQEGHVVQSACTLLRDIFRQFVDVYTLHSEKSVQYKREILGLFNVVMPLLPEEGIGSTRRSYDILKKINQGYSLHDTTQEAIESIQEPLEV